MLEIIRYWVDVLFSLVALIGAIGSIVIMLSASIFAMYLVGNEIRQRYIKQRNKQQGVQ